MTADGTVKIVDFGVSEMFSTKGEDRSNKPSGSPGRTKHNFSLFISHSPHKCSILFARVVHW